MRTWFPMAVHLLEGLFLGMRNTEATVRQRERLRPLGSLSAGLTHELNNPAAAAVRATGQLRDRVAGMRHKLGMIAEGGCRRTRSPASVSVQEEAVERAAKSRHEHRTPMQEADLEDALADWLDEHGVASACELAPCTSPRVWTSAGWTGSSRRWAEDQVDGALRWLAYTLETELLMDEIEDATGRISTWSPRPSSTRSSDGAPCQEVDVHDGLDSTVVMLGHKMQGVEVVKEYDRTLPKVPAYAAELNQVWTNLIDNAADAMGGRGRLLLRTRRDGDCAVVDVCDDGPGMPDTVQPQVFDPFFTTKAPGEGTGLGLDSARRIVEKRHRGRLSFTTGVDGTTFEVRLPLVQQLA